MAEVSPLPLNVQDESKAGRKRKADTLIGRAIDTDSKLLKLLDADMIDVYNMAKSVLHDPNSRTGEKLKAGQIMKAWRDDVYKKAMDSKETLDTIQSEPQQTAVKQKQIVTESDIIAGLY